MPCTIISDVSPSLLTTSFVTLRWYGLLFATGILGGMPLWYHMCDKAGKSRKEAEQIATYTMLSVVIGARLGHIIFYNDWHYYKTHLLEIFLPITFSPTFKIIGFSGLASHGAAFAMIITVLLYVKRIKISFFPPRIHFKNRRSAGELLWILDHLSVLFPLGAALIRMGNFMNSEIIGKPTGSHYGFIFARSIHDDLCNKYPSMIQHITIRKATAPQQLPIIANYQSIELAITFKDTITDAQHITNFLQKSLKNDLVQVAYFSPSPNIYETYGSPLAYTLEKQNGGYQAHVYTWGIPRHPAQLYESFSYFLLFIVLLLWWRRKGQTLAPGRIFGTLMIAAACLRFFYEFYKENQVAFEDDMCLNMGQLLSLPCIIIGLFCILRTSVKSVPKANLK